VIVEQSGVFSYISADRWVPQDHLLLPIRVMADAMLEESGRASMRCMRKANGDPIPPQKAGHKSFKRNDHKQTPPNDPGNASSDLHGKRRQRHQSTGLRPHSVLWTNCAVTESCGWLEHPLRAALFHARVILVAKNMIAFGIFFSRKGW
jgi:hypothetical protein